MRAWTPWNGQWPAKRTSILPILLALILFAGLPADSRAASDAWIQTRIVTAYTLSEHLNPFDIQVKVTEGAVVLTGEVETDIERDLAGQIARGADGVKSVRNDIAVAPDSDTEREPSSFYRAVSDATTTARVKTNLLWNEHVAGRDIRVSTENGIVRLEGTVASDAERDLAVQLARNTGGVESVRNEIAVRDMEKTDASMMDKATRTIGDTVLTGRVKTVLMASKGMEGAEVEVRTEEGVVTLTGAVTSREQAAHVVRVVDNVESVREVVSELKIAESKVAEPKVE